MCTGGRVGTIPQIHFTDEQASDPHKTRHHIGAALEASCETLLTLELVRAAGKSAAADLGGIELQLLQAIESLRHAIAELRLASREKAGVLTLGFVVGAGRGFKRPGSGKPSFQAAPNRIDRSLDATR